MLKRKTINTSIRKELLSRITCANNPLSPATGCKGYICPLWKCDNGLFDESGKEIDHIIEVTLGGTNDINNLQVLCPCCHSVKTKRCTKQKWEFNRDKIDNNHAHIEIENLIKRNI